jgi:hypothetical protein
MQDSTILMQYFLYVSGWADGYPNGHRLREAGADAFTIMRLAGQSSVIRKSTFRSSLPESMKRAFNCLEAFNGKAMSTRTVRSPRKTPQTCLGEPCKLLKGL